MTRSPYYLEHTFALCVALLLLGWAKPVQAENPCAQFISTPERTLESRRITALDLIRLRDIGYSHIAPAQRLLGVSPDRQHVAFMMHRADPVSNRYCEGLALIGVNPGDSPRLLDVSDEVIMQPYSIRGVLVDYGYPTVIIPRWSPDGLWIAYLKRQNGHTQVWRVRSDGTAVQQVTHSAVDVEAFDWSESGDAILFGSRPGRIQAQEAIDQEAQIGFLYDDRLVPYSSSTPAMSGSLPYERLAVVLATGQVRPLAEAELARFSGPGAADPAENMQSAPGPKGQRAWTARRDASNYLSPVELWATAQSGRSVRCEAAACNGAMSYEMPGVWWMPDRNEILFLRREGWSNSDIAAYRWSPGSPVLRRIFSTEDLLVGCELIGRDLLCAQESSTKPRRLVLIDSTTGRFRPLYDPNPDFSRIQLGTVQRLHWRNEFGVESYGDLVLPPGHRPGERHPLIVVQYQTQGFLRGGIADEYPIQLFAAAGYAVLSFQAPPAFSASSQTGQTFEAAAAALNQQWSRRRNIFSSLVSGVRLLIQEHVVDPDRIGITGASDGSTTIQFALINEPELFTAASVSSCCLEPSAFFIYGGTALAEESRQRGFPPARGEGVSGWRPQSIVMNAANIRAPILMNLADHEYLTGVDAFMALRERGLPVEMYIFPNEFHLKWQPIHRLAIYQRNMDWFDFWLRGVESNLPERPAEYSRWRIMRDNQCRQSTGDSAPWYCRPRSSSQ